jgi:hypothetical protein
MWLGTSQRGKGREWEENGEQRRDGVGPGGFYLLATARSMVHFDGNDWRVWAVRWGRRCGLSSVVWSRSSGVR